MKRKYLLFGILVFALLIPTIVYAAGGFDEWGYNYTAKLFNGMYCDYHPSVRPGGANHDSCMASFGNVNLEMKWNDAWLSKYDRDGDGSLDRHYGFDSYIGSGAWTTNHMSEQYIGDDGKKHTWVYFTKIVAKPTEDYDCAANGGAQIWGDFCTILSIYNDPYGGATGVELKAANPGFGVYK